MGAIFELVADGALQKMDSGYTECHVCDMTGVDLYPYQGSMYDTNGNKLDDSYDTYAVCAACISAGGLVTHVCDFEYIRTIDAYLEGLELNVEDKAGLRARLVDKYQRTPDIPIFMQGEDRPLCCGDITEFTGYPQNDDELYGMGETYRYWEKGVIAECRSVDFKKHGRPESHRDVAGFRCKHCGQSYFTFQFT